MNRNDIIQTLEHSIKSMDIGKKWMSIVGKANLRPGNRVLLNRDFDRMAVATLEAEEMIAQLKGETK